MPKPKVVWVLLNENGDPIRIFKNKHVMLQEPDQQSCVQMLYKHAVASIRWQVFDRCDGFCDKCGKRVGEDEGHMHEKIWRGQGGEISLSNSVFLCPLCHFKEHASRSPQFSKKDLTK
jgi:hypothetical protein